MRSFIRGEIGKGEASKALDKEWKKRFEVVKLGQYQIISPKSVNSRPRTPSPSAS